MNWLRVEIYSFRLKFYKWKFSRAIKKFEKAGDYLEWQNQRLGMAFYELQEACENFDIEYQERQENAVDRH